MITYYLHDSLSSCLFRYKKEKEKEKKERKEREVIFTLQAFTSTSLT